MNTIDHPIDTEHSALTGLPLLHHLHTGHGIDDIGDLLHQLCPNPRGRTYVDLGVAHRRMHMHVPD